MSLLDYTNEELLSMHFKSVRKFIGELDSMPDGETKGTYILSAFALARMHLEIAGLIDDHIELAQRLGYHATVKGEK